MYDDDELERRHGDAELMGFDAEEAEALAGGVAPEPYQSQFNSMLPYGDEGDDDDDDDDDEDEDEEEEE